MKKYLLYILLITAFLGYAQNKIDIKAKFDVEKSTVSIDQIIEYKNTTNKFLDTIYLNDWSNSYATKNTPLAERKAEEFSTSFHFAKNEDRGFTSIFEISNSQGIELYFERLQDQIDILKVALNEPLAPDNSYKIHLTYSVKLPNDKFTSYGETSFKEFNLKYWYITPAIFNGDWHYFSNKNLDDLYTPKADLNFEIEFPRNYLITSELNVLNKKQHDTTQTVYLSGEERVDTRLFLHKFPKFRTTQTDDFSLITDIIEEDIHPTNRAIIIDKITQFITQNIGEYPHQNLIVSKIDADKDPIYGLNQLPNFIRPFPEHFQYELTLLKSALNNFLNNTLLINPRKDQWLKDGIQIYYLMKYIEINYPDMKLLGTLANAWLIRSFHLADLDFNEQYRLVYMHMARTNRDQPLTMAKDSLLKFNANLANKYKAGVGLKLLDSYINANIFENSIKTFYNEKNLQPVNSRDFETFLKSRTDKDLNWFFTDYLTTRKKIDFKLKNIEEGTDSISFTIKNKRDTNIPVALFTLNNDSVTSKTWINNVQGEQNFTIPKDSVTQIVLNYDNASPEFNMRDNYRRLDGGIFNRKPLQFRIFQDVEDPQYNQVFFMPTIQYRNIYDGLQLGVKMYNKTILRRPFNWRISPEYGFGSKRITGSAAFLMYQNIEDKDLFAITYGVSGSYRSYAEDLFRRKIQPSIRFSFRDKNNLRSNKTQSINLRYLYINRDEDINNISDVEDPNYGVFNVRYTNSDFNLIDTKRYTVSYELSKDFSKVSIDYRYRKLFESNRQFEWRIFAGAFLYNNNSEDSDYFSFALDRPTDYLFDYNYLGRSEDSGIFSQQLIIAEGGFKSQLEPAFANQWIATTNVSTSIWRYIQVYGDLGFVKNKGESAKFVYDSGIRLNLVQDYFELYFPIYSNLGWEIAQPNYDEKIRFIFTVDPQTLLGLFRRRWY